MRHAALERLCTLVGGFSRYYGIQRATIPVTHCPAKVVRKDRAPVHHVGDVIVIKLPRDAPGWAPRTRIPHLWIFEGASEEAVGFQPGTSYHQQKQVPAVLLDRVL